MSGQLQISTCQRCLKPEVEVFYSRDGWICEECLEETKPTTRNERLQLAADRGFDTWDDYRGER